MKPLIFTVLVMGIVATCNAQQMLAEKSKEKTAPPLVEKSVVNDKKKPKVEVKFIPAPKKEKQSKGKTQKSSVAGIYNPPPMIQRDTVRKQ